MKKIHQAQLINNEYYILKNGKTSCLGYFNPINQLIERVEKQYAYGIKPRNAEQTFAIHALLNPNIKLVTLQGVAGTGKTLLALAAAIEQRKEYAQVILARPIVPLSNRDIGFLPGTEKEKASVYEEPYKDIAIDLFQRGDAYEILKNKSMVHFMTTSFIRGITLRDTVIIIDECQNMSFHELDSIITRIGENCRVMFCGDFRQADLKANGLQDFIRVLKRMDKFTFVEFKVEDIVRSDFVKQYIISKYELNL